MEEELNAWGELLIGGLAGGLAGSISVENGFSGIEALSVTPAAAIVASFPIGGREVGEKVLNRAGIGVLGYYIGLGIGMITTRPEYISAINQLTNYFS